MPTYTYECSECHTVFDTVTTSSDRDTPQQCVCGDLAPRSFAAELKGKTNVDATMVEN